MPRNPALAAVTNGGTVNWKQTIAGWGFSMAGAAVAFAVAWGALNTKVEAATGRLDYQRSTIAEIRTVAMEAKVTNAAATQQLKDIAEHLNRVDEKLDRVIERGAR